LYSILKTPVAGYVTGDFGGVALQPPNGGSPPTISLQPSQSVAGSLVIPAPAAGSGVVSLGFYPPVPAGCKSKFVNVSRCRLVAMATTSTNLNIAAPIVQVRISGASYAHISRPDGRDQATDHNDGYLYVMHDPGCGWWGNDGKDMFFD